MAEELAPSSYLLRYWMFDGIVYKKCRSLPKLQQKGFIYEIRINGRDKDIVFIRY